MELIEKLSDVIDNDWYLIKYHKRDSTSWLVAKISYNKNHESLNVLSLLKGAISNATVNNEKDPHLERFIALVIFTIFSPLLLPVMIMAIIAMKSSMDLDSYNFTNVSYYKFGSKESDMCLFEEEIVNLINEKRLYKLDTKEVVIYQL